MAHLGHLRPSAEAKGFPERGTAGPRAPRWERGRGRRTHGGHEHTTAQGRPLSRDLVEEATATAEDGTTVTVRALSEDRDAGEPCVANRAAAELVIALPDGTSLVLALPGAEAEKIVRPLAKASVVIESEADVARRYLRLHGRWLTEEQIGDLRRRAGEA